MAEAFDAAEGSDGVSRKPITPEHWIDGRGNEAVLAIDQNGAEGDARELGCCLDGIDCDRVGFEGLKGECFGRAGRGLRSTGRFGGKSLFLPGRARFGSGM